MQTEQTVATYKGTPITELSRDELLVALSQAYTTIDTMRRQALDVLELDAAFVGYRFDEHGKAVAISEEEFLKGIAAYPRRSAHSTRT